MANTYLQEAFKQLDILNEEDFNLSDKDSFNDLQEFDDDEQMVIDIIDDEASSEEELEDSYIGDVILDCEVCHSKIYKDASEVTVNEETNLANEGEECPFCYSSDGFKVIGQVAPYGEVDEEEIESKDEEEIEDSTEEDEEKEEVKESICNCRKHRKTINESVKKVLKESLGDYEELVDDLADRAKSIFDGMEHGDDIQEEMFTAIYQAVDDGLIYYDDQWTVLKHYFNASDLLFSEKNYGAIERLYDDVMDTLETMLDTPIGESLNKKLLKKSFKESIIKDPLVKISLQKYIEKDDLESFQDWIDQVWEWVYDEDYDMDFDDAFMESVNAAGNWWDVVAYGVIKAIAEQSKPISIGESLKKKSRGNRKVLKEGAGAGYSIKATGTVDSISNVHPIGDVQREIWNKEHNVGYDYVDVTLDLKGTLDSIEAYSYMYGDSFENTNIPFVATKARIYLNDGENIEDVINDCIGDSVSVDFVYGGGWSHSTFDGSLSDERHRVECGVYSDVQLIDAKIVDEEWIDQIDIMVQAPDEELEESLNKESLKESMSATKDTIVKDWYKSAYPTDELGDELYDFVTFDMIYKYPANVYEMTYSDSVVRERIFTELCNIYGCEYDDIYHRWLYEKPLSIDELNKAFNLIEESLDEAIAPEDNPNHKEGRPYWYFTKHGVQPGSVPKGIEIEEVRDDEHGHGTYFSTYHLLTTQELEDYDIKERRPMDESIEGAIVETEDEVMEMTTNEEGGITINTTPKQEEPEMGEMIAPLEPEVEEEIKDASEEEMEKPIDDETDIDMEEIDEESFDELGESFLKKAYENVNSFKTSRVTEKGNTLVVEGVINFKSGNTKKTTFIFEAKDVTKNGTMRFIGENKELSRGKKSFTLRGKMDGTKFIAESLGYNYRAKLEEGKSTRIYGTVRLNEAQKGNNGSERKDIFDKVVFELQSEDEGELPRKVKSKKADRYSQAEIGTDSENVIVTADNFEHARKVAKAFGLKTKETKRQITIYIPQKGLTNHYSEAGGKKAPNTKKKRTVIQGKKITPAVNK